MCTPPRSKITSGVILTLHDWLDTFCYFSVHFMALVIDVIDRHSPSYKMHHQLQLKMNKVTLYYLFT